ncbi:YwqI/YxiC family protein [Priestia flexa]|uniref:DUF5344 family protein n=1 Tax=Priestia flexa TaxID=86664 RepID=A0ABU4J7D7_9BACI|nr:MULTISPECIES: DUF5344 family protein [Bacillaceae]OZT13612.1 hypothetical protein CHN50_03270 [Priestia aryabhattai]USY53309.1 YwqI/YxiC family protein [Bacillus sp. 1780r2a1]MBN8435040.1 YwqI/YxiC family protein [Priestia flexa]MCA0967457.1 YwqI/YxiC family protein [Priestia flexa]MCG7314626.1 YwqI/YxiC family protein [Priestia flexa]
MTSIKLNYEDVMQKLEDVETAIQKLSLPGNSDVGDNNLSTTNEWKSQEEELGKLLKTYITALEKSVQDTKANVKLLKEQDEAIVRS